MGMTSIADIIYVVGGEGETGSPLPPLQYFHQQDQWQEFEDPFLSTGRISGWYQSGPSSMRWEDGRWHFRCAKLVLSGDLHDYDTDCSLISPQLPKWIIDSSALKRYIVGS